MAANSMKKSLEELILQLYDIQAVKFGSFTLKSGIQSPVYFDLRVIVSYPDLMNQVSEFLWNAVSSHADKFVSVCGVPYTALPLATLIAAHHKLPMLIRRKEAKDYGTKKIIEGHYQAGDNCLIVEDVVTSGSSVLETVESLKKESIVVTDAVVLLDREQGGRDRLEVEGIKLHSICPMSKLLEILEQAGKLDNAIVTSVKQFIAENNTFNPSEKNGPSQPEKILTYEDRASLATHPLTKRLFTIMAEKKTNLALSADVTSSKELLQLADSIGPHICVLKTHVDILEDFSDDFVKQLVLLANKHNFLLFEDRKFADIGNTVKHQYSGGVYKISDWAHITNAHALPGPGIVQGLKEIGLSKERGCLLLAEMSSKGSLATGEYTKATVNLANDHRDFVMGFICQSRLSQDPAVVHMTPGIQMACGGDALGQQYLTPQEVITHRRSDIIIVGRGILQAPEPTQAAKDFQQAGYSAYNALFH